jgi:spore coat protein U-like protein
VTNLKIKLNGKVGKHKLEILTLLICSALVVSAYALTYLWSAPSAVAITTSVQNIIVLDSLGNEVTSIDFGNLNPGSYIDETLVIKNTSPNATISINWQSTVNSVTQKIQDSLWFGGSWPWSLGPGQSITVYYRIYVAADCPLQTYSWTLYIIPG